MMDKQLRLLAGLIVSESKMSKPAKLQMLEFIQHEATDAQVKALLMDGKITKLDEQAEQIVNARFSQLKIVSEISGAEGFGHVILKLTNGEVVVGTALAASAIIWMAGKAMETYAMTEKECRNYKYGSKPWKICQKQVANKRDQKKIEVMKSKMNLCNNSKKPDKCKAKVNEKIIELQTKIKTRNARINTLKKSS